VFKNQLPFTVFYYTFFVNVIVAVSTLDGSATAYSGTYKYLGKKSLTLFNMLNLIIWYFNFSKMFGFRQIVQQAQ
jgi:hypothetical protein